ncbi:MAG: AzlD domain-containing protein [Mesorhizobium sp.]|nr:AzlD domain-containing protein [Mesorhizobium sp.]MCO5163425.1 AzlD domain-containing protein [Mesorhizobium sp.]
MSFLANDGWWWPYLFILLAGWLATDVWRFLGVFIGGRVSEESDAMVLVRTIATALVAAVIANLIVFPGGVLADTSVALRIGAAAAGFAAYLALRHSMLAGIVVSEVVLIGGMVAGF